jgi:hypothetical protein
VNLIVKDQAVEDLESLEPEAEEGGLLAALEEFEEE